MGLEGRYPLVLGKSTGLLMNLVRRMKYHFLKSNLVVALAGLVVEVPLQGHPSLYKVLKQFKLAFLQFVWKSHEELDNFLSVFTLIWLCWRK